MLIAGCSHAAGSEIDGTEDSSYNRNASFGGQLALKLGYYPVNISVGGQTNHGIVRSILKWFSANYDPKTMDVIVLVAWTESMRMEIPCNEPIHYETGAAKCANWFDVTLKYFNNMNPGWHGNNPTEKEMAKYYHRFMATNETYLQLQTANLVLQLQYFFHHKKVRYIMCNSMMSMQLPNVHLSFYMDLIEADKYMNIYTQKEDSFYWKYRNLGYVNSKAKYWHHDEEPHLQYAGELHSFMKENNVYYKIL